MVWNIVSNCQNNHHHYTWLNIRCCRLAPHSKWSYVKKSSFVIMEPSLMMDPIQVATLALMIICCESSYIILMAKREPIDLYLKIYGFDILTIFIIMMIIFIFYVLCHSCLHEYGVTLQILLMLGHIYLVALQCLDDLHSSGAASTTFLVGKF